MSDMKITYLDSAAMGATSLEPIARLGDFTEWYSSTPEEALERVADSEVIVVNKIIVNERLLEAAPKLRLVCEAATGVNNIDLEACAKRGIIVRNVAGYSTESVVQSTFMHLLSLVGYARYMDSVVKSGEYSKSGIFTDVKQPFMEIDGKMLGIIGMGTIGNRVAQVAQAFGMKVIYYSTSGTNHCALYPAVTLEELMRASDVVSVHAPYNSRTAGLVGEKELRLMKPTAFILNLGRGGIVDEAALAKVIDEGVIAGAGIDVYTTEPIFEDNPLMKVKHPERLSLSPHSAWASIEARERLVEGIAANIAKGFKRTEGDL